MKYMGSKRRLWKDISPIIFYKRESYSCYVEPFCGGCNSICQVPNTIRRIAADINPYLIAMWKMLLADEPVIYPISKELYNRVKQSWRNGTDEFTDAEKGWVGYMASFRGRFFEGGFSNNNAYAPKSKGGIRHYQDESIRNIMAQLPLLKGVYFTCCDYAHLAIPKQSIIYCDIPYRDTTEYNGVQAFDYEAFYDWAIMQHERGNRVYISEFSLPDERFECIWEKDIKCNISTLKGVRTEKLFIPK